MTRNSAERTNKKHSVVSKLPVTVWFDGEELLFTEIIFGKEDGIFYKNRELADGVYHLWGELTRMSTGKVSKVHIKYRRSGAEGVTVEQANFKGRVGSSYNRHLLNDIISGWEYALWAKTYTPFFN
jgi:hypothetical protein